MKALLVTNDFPPMTGGEATWYGRLCQTLSADRVAVLAPSAAGDRACDARQPYDVWRVRAPLSPRPFARTVQIILLGVHAARLLRREHIAVVHVGHLYLGPVGLVLNRLFHVPYVLYLHGGEMAPYLRYGIVRRAVARIVGGARLIVVNSRYTAETYRAMGIDLPPTALLTIGVDVDRFRPDLDGRGARTRYGLDGTSVLLTVGRLVERKGHDTVIRALAHIRNAIGPVRYLIVGSGPEEGRLRALARDLDSDKEVVFTGRVPADDLPGLYAACDLFVMPSRALRERDGVEGFGVVFLEAGAAGKAVVGGRTGGIAEAVIDGVTGRLVDPDNPQALADVLIDLLRDPGKARALGARARQRAVQLAAAYDAKAAEIWTIGTGGVGVLSLDAQ